MSDKVKELSDSITNDMKKILETLGDANDKALALLDLNLTDLQKKAIGAMGKSFTEIFEIVKQANSYNVLIRQLKPKIDVN